MNPFVSKGAIRCNRCSRMFVPHLDDEPQPDGGVLRTFTCPRCFERYIGPRISRKGLELTEQLQNTDARNRREVKRLQKLIKMEVTRG